MKKEFTIPLKEFVPSFYRRKFIFTEGIFRAEIVVDGRSEMKMTEEGHLTKSNCWHCLDWIQESVESIRNELGQ